MAARKVWHVRWDPKQRHWFVHRSNKQAFEAFGSKDTAVDAAKETAKNNRPSEVKVHKQDGHMNHRYVYKAE